MPTEKPPGLLCGRCDSRCEHSDQRMVKFTQQNGRLAYRHQCFTCGHGQGASRTRMSRTRTRSRGDDPWPREPPKPRAWWTWTAPNFTIGTARAYSPAGLAGPPAPRTSRSLMNDLESKIFGRFDDDTVVHPGHGDDTTLGTERPHLAEWWKRGW
jgi:hypothetical protein